MRESNLSQKALASIFIVIVYTICMHLHRKK